MKNRQILSVVQKTNSRIREKSCALIPIVGVGSLAGPKHNSLRLCDHNTSPSPYFDFVLCARKTTRVFERGHIIPGMFYPAIVRSWVREQRTLKFEPPAELSIIIIINIEDDSGAYHPMGLVHHVPIDLSTI